MRPVVNISEWMPYPPPSPSARSAATTEGTAPMPVCSVAPSGTKARTCSAMARSMSLGGASSMTTGSLLLSISTSMSSTATECG